MEPTSAADNDKPHAVFFPFPAQGHVKPAFLLAKLLYHRGFHVTFVHSEHNRRRLLRSRGAAELAGVPGFRFVAVPDGLPLSDEDASQDMAALLSSLETLVPHFNNLLSELNDGASCGGPPVTCVVSDISSILRATKEMGVHAVALWTASSCAFMGYLQYQQLIDKGIIPLKGR